MLLASLRCRYSFCNVRSRFGACSFFGAQSAVLRCNLQALASTIDPLDRWDSHHEVFAAMQAATSFASRPAATRTAAIRQRSAVVTKARGVLVVAACVAVCSVAAAAVAAATAAVAVAVALQPPPLCVPPPICTDALLLPPPLCPAHSLPSRRPPAAPRYGGRSCPWWAPSHSALWWPRASWPTWPAPRGRR